MSALILIFGGGVVLFFTVVLLLSTRSILAQLVAWLMSLGFALFCVFGFLASFEPSDSPNWPWQVVYGVLGIASLGIPLGFLGKRRPGNHANKKLLS